MPRTLHLILSTSLLAGPFLGACDKDAPSNSQPTGQADQGARSAETPATKNEPGIGDASKAMAKYEFSGRCMCSISHRVVPFC